MDEKRGIDQTIELAPDGADKKEIYWAMGGSDRTAAYNADTWQKVAVPTGMSSEQFDNAVLNSALRETMAQRGHTYFPTGNTNSNRFVFNIITGAGGLVPGNAAAGFN